MVPIFQEMKKFKEIRVTHGASERGKDIVLVEEDALGDLIYTALVIKNTRITNAIVQQKNRESVSTVIDQIILTINSGYDCSTQKNHVAFNKIIVITSKDISHTAVEEFNKLSKRYNNINISTKEGKDIVKWIDSYIPHFFEMNSGKLSVYISELQNRCEQLNELKNISGFKGEVKKIIDIFVSPKLFRLTRKDIHGKVQTKPIYGHLERIIFEQHNILIGAGPGAGKSTLLRAEIQKLLSLNTRGRILNFPILIKASALVTLLRDHTIIPALNEFIQTDFGIKDFDLNMQLRLDDMAVYLFIDGLDEVRLVDDRTLLKEQVKQLVKDHTKLKVIITSRETKDLEAIDMPTFRKWDLLPFEYKQVQKFIAGWFKDKKSDQILETLKEHELLEKLPRTPLVLTLLAILFEDENQVEVPANLSELYQMFVDLLVGKWNLDRKIDTFYKANVIEHMLSEVAMILHDSGRLSMSQVELSSIIKTVWDNDVGLPIDYEDFQRSLFEQTGLLVFNDKEDVEFRHLSFQEYLVAKCLTKREDNLSRDVFKQRFLDDWWSQVIYYFCGLKQKNNLLLHDLAEAAEQSSSATQIKAIWNLGYIIQTSYLTKLKTRKECIKRQLAAYAKSVSRLMVDQKSGNLMKEVPPALLVLSMIHGFKIHYSSKFLLDMYKEIFDELISSFQEKQPLPFDDCLQLTLISSIFADLDIPEYFLDIYDLTKHEVLINIVIDYELNMILETNSSHANISRFKKISRKIREQMRNSISLYKLQFKAPKMAEVEQDDESLLQVAVGIEE